MGGDDVFEVLADLLGYAACVAADVEVGAVLEPLHSRAVFAHPVLDVDLVALVAGEGEVKAIEAGCLVRLQILAVGKANA